MIHAFPYNKTQTINSAERWAPSTQAWTSTGNLNASRGAESMTVLANGQALVAGGEAIDKHTGQPVILAAPNSASRSGWNVTMNQFERVSSKLRIVEVIEQPVTMELSDRVKRPILGTCCGSRDTVAG